MKRSGNISTENFSTFSLFQHSLIMAKIFQFIVKRMSREHRNYSIIKIGQNTETSPGDLKRVIVHQTLMKKPLAYAGVKKLKLVFIIIYSSGVFHISIS